MAKGSKLTGALARAPKEKVGERLSPGVYRGDKGSLVNKSGRVIPRGQPSSPQMPPPGAWHNLPGFRGMEGQMNSNPWEGVMGKGPAMDPGYNQGGPGAINEAARLAGMYAGNPNNIESGMYTVPNMPQMPQPSANNGGQYRLSPGVYGTREQAMNQYNQQMQQMTRPIPNLQNGLGQQGNMPPANWVPYTQRRG